jgi:hypothetical protein
MNKVGSWLKRIILFASPIIALLIVYIILDPFKVVKQYSSYYISDEIIGVTLNFDYVSTSTFENNYPSCRYNSFIFGNSRSRFYESADWKCYLDKNSIAFHFDASNEALYGILKKLRYINNRQEVHLNNVLLILDYSTLNQVVPLESHLFAISPQLENNRNLIPFHLSFIKAFFTPKFMIAFVDYKISGKVKNYMTKGALLSDIPLHYELKTNEISFLYFEELIENGKYYTPERMRIFYSRDSIQSFYPLVIEEQQKKMLAEINEILVKHKTNFKIIINPLYDQKKINVQDLAYLESLFGANNVFDFSGINKFTNDYSNYYEESHYRPHVAREILKEIYCGK